MGGARGGERFAAGFETTPHDCEDDSDDDDDDDGDGLHEGDGLGLAVDEGSAGWRAWRAKGLRRCLSECEFIS